MAKPNKAQITYKANGLDSTIRFHSVIAEEHIASTQITKFPVQSGFNISNHAIRMNRVVTITGIVSNSQVVGTETFNSFDDSKNVVRLMFSVLKDLVKGAVPCSVSTNYGDYSLVIFTKFRTKLVAGKTDILKFTMTGEETQVGTTINGNKPNLLVFTPIDSTETEAYKKKLTDSGLDVSDTAVLSRAPVGVGESYQLESVDSVGNTSITTIEDLGTNIASGETIQMMHTDIIDITGLPEVPDVLSTVTDSLGLPDISLTGLGSISPCIMSSVGKLIEEEASNQIDTALGKLNKSSRGAKYSVVGVNGKQSFGQTVLDAGIDCFVTGATEAAIGGFFGIPTDSFSSGLPSVEGALDSAVDLGSTITSNATDNITTEIIKITGG